MKKRILIVSVALMLMAAGCVAQTQAEPVPAPEMEEEKVNIVMVNVARELTEPIFQSAEDELELKESMDQPEQSDAVDVTMLYKPSEEEISKAENAVVFTDDPEFDAQGVSAVIENREEVFRSSWEVLYNYPTHCSPIRLLTLVENQNSTAYGIYTEMLEAGKLQNKGLFVKAEAELSPEEWVAAALEEVPVGLLDTIYAETQELAIAAYNALRAAERNDSVEVICAELSEELVALMIEDHWSMGAGVCISMADAADKMLELAENMAEDGSSSVIELVPRVVCSDDVMELYKAGTEDPALILEELLNREE